MARHTTLTLDPHASPGELDRGSVLFIGTATTLVRAGGFTILTHPNFLHAGDHAHLGYGMTSRRLTEPALDVGDLPPLDACVLSHFHGDHWDEVATARLPKSLPVLTTRHAERALRLRGFRAVRALATWDTVTLRRGDAWLRVTSLPGRHGPPILSALLPAVMGSMLELGAGAAPPRYRLYVSGDTLVFDDLHEIPRRYPRVDLGLFHLGGTRVAGLLVTMDAHQGVEAIRIVQPDVAVPIHFDDYPVFKSPLEDFLRAAERAGLGPRVHVLGRGERYDFVIGAPRAAEGRGPGARTVPGPGAGADVGMPGHVGE